MAGNDANTRMLLHFDDAVVIDDAIGASAERVATDDAVSASEAQIKFGIGSLYCDGGTWLQIGSSKDFNFDDGDWTIDFWCRIESAGDAHLFAFYAGDDNLLTLERVRTVADSVELRLRYREDDIAIVTLDSATNELIDTGNWTHVAIVRYGTAVTLYVDGDEYAAGTIAEAHPVNFGYRGWPLYIGRATVSGQSGLRRLVGYIDEFRVHAAAAYTEAFTPPVSAYTALSNVNGRSTYHINGTSSVGGQEKYNLGVGEHTVGGRSLSDYQLAFVCGWGDRYDIIIHGEYSVGGRSTLNVTGTDRLGGRSLYDLIASNLLGGRSYHDIEDTSLDSWLLYYGFNEAPDMATPLAVIASLPHDEEIAGEGIHYFVLRKRNQWGLVSDNVYSEDTGDLASWAIELDGDDVEIMRRPSSPVNMTVYAIAGGKVRVDAEYLYPADGERQADQWRVFVTTNGTDPNPDGSGETYMIVKADGIGKLSLETTLSEGVVFKVIVRVRRSTDLRTDLNTTIGTATATLIGPAAPVITKVQRINSQRVELP